jgi:pimeloyl-ACP methyl ester carboxylesterase
MNTMENSPSSTSCVKVRGLRYGVRRWGSDSASPIVMLHGTRDTSATFQFLVDHLKRDWHVVAPDWRGHGRSEWTPGAYWLHEFVADLDSFLECFFPGRPVALVGHSLGGNIAGIYAGLRPSQVSHLISLDGFGPLVNRLPVDVTEVLSSFLESLKAQPRRGRYATINEMAARIRTVNPRLNDSMANFLAQHSTRISSDGAYEWLYDPTHRFSLPSLHSIEEWGAIWQRIVAPVLWMVSQDKRPGAPFGIAGEIERRAAYVPTLQLVELPGTGHNLHHDAPEQVAYLIEEFISNSSLPLTANPSS